MNLPKIQAIAAPLSAPIPSALGVAVQAYLYFVPQSAILGWIAAIGAFVGIEAIGGASCYAVVKLHRQKSYGIEFYVSLVGILAYIASGYFVLHNTAILIFFILAPFSYFAYSILRNMQDEHIEKVSETEAHIKLIQAEAQSKALEVEAQTRLIEAQIKQINAETRKTKAANVVLVQPVRGVNEQTVQAEQGYGKAVFDVLDSGEQLGPRAMSRRLGCSASTAKTHIDRWTTLNGKAHGEG